VRIAPGPLRALITHLDRVSDEASARLEVPTGLPLVYDPDHDMRPAVPGGQPLRHGA
jgi:2,3-bisphosphoglycerate-dependent phosphoglycerate mutase